MKRQQQPNVSACLPTALAIVLGIDVQEIFQELGHDGMQVIFPNLVGPRKYRSFHIQDIVDCCLNRGYAVTRIEARSGRQEGDQFWEMDGDREKRFNDYLNGSVGILEGKVFGSRGHAVAWDGIEKVLHDPDAVIVDFRNFQIRSFLKITPIPGLDSGKIFSQVV